MPDFGVTDAGYVLPTQQQLLDLMAADEKATINPNADTSSDSVLGQINGVVTRQLMIGYEGQQVAYYSNDRDVVEGFLQTQLAKLTGTARDGATQSKVILNCNLDLGTTLLTGITLAAIAGNPDSQWTPAADYTAASAGDQDVPFVSVTTGPNAADIGTITVRTTTVVGWNSVNNVAAATPGTNVESDADLRTRSEQELQGGGAGNVDAIRAALLKINEPVGPFVQSAEVLNNVTDFVDADGLPPHSTEAIIYDGVTPTVSNDAIAQVLWDKGGAGIRNYGSSSGTAIDALGNPQTVFFTRVAVKLVYLAFAVTPRLGYVTDATFKTRVSAACNGPNEDAELVAFGVGDDVDPYDIVMNTKGLGAQVMGLALGLTPPGIVPSSIATATIPIGPREIANFDITRITVNGV